MVSVAVAAVLQLALGLLYLVSGLAVPGLVVLAMLAFWVLQVVVGFRLARRRSWWVLAVPVVGFAVFLAVIWFGDAVLGWTA